MQDRLPNRTSLIKVPANFLELSLCNVSKQSMSGIKLFGEFCFLFFVGGGGGGLVARKDTG